MGLRITNCIATPNSVIVFFSAPVDRSSAETAANYHIDCPIGNVIANFDTPVADSINGMTVTIPLASPGLERGLWLSLVVNNVFVSGNPNDYLPAGSEGSNTFATQVDGDDTAVAKETRAVEDAIAYPVLTEEVGSAPSLAARMPSTPSMTSSTAPLGQIVTGALNDVLGWKIKPGDSKGFLGALNASFVPKESDGNTAYTWTPRSYAVQTDLSGGITGAQASIYVRAKDALDKALPLLDGLSALDTEAVTDDVAALKGIVRGQLAELVKELGQVGGPRVSRVNQYFGLLIGLNPPFPLNPIPNQPLAFSDPDKIFGTLGTLRDELGLNSTTQDFVNSVTDEEDLSNFRILSDYITSLAQSWLNNLGFFGLDTTTPFFGTQLVLLSRQLSVVAESVDEVRFTLDSVFIGPAERQTLQLKFNSGDPAMFVEDLLTWIQSFASDEGPRLIQDGGKFGVQNTFVPVASQLKRLVNGVLDSNGASNGLPPGFHTARVQRALEELNDELQELVNLATPIKHVITPVPEFELPFTITRVEPSSFSVSTLSARSTGGFAVTTVSVRGEGFELYTGNTRNSVSGPTISFAPATAVRGSINTTEVYFRSDRVLVAKLAISVDALGTWDITVQNPDGPSTTLSGGFTVTR